MDAGEVDADLVRAPSADADFEIAEARPLFEKAVLGDCAASGGEFRGHAGAAQRIASNVSGDSALILFHAAMGERQINFFDFAVVKLRGERLMGLIGSSDNEHAAGFAIDAMNDAGTQVAIDGGEGSEVMEQRVHESAGGMPRPGVNHHASGLIDNDHVGIFVEDGERKILGLGLAEGREINGRDGDGFAAAHEMGRASGCAIDLDAIFFDPRLQTRTAELRQALMQEAIETLACIGRFDDEIHLFRFSFLGGVWAGVTEFSGFDGKGQTILPGRQRASGVGSEGAGRCIGAIEIEIDAAIDGQRNVQHATSLIGAGFVGEVFEQEVKRLAVGGVFVDGAKAIGVPLVSELDQAGALFEFSLAEDVEDRNPFDVGNEVSIEAHGRIDGEIFHALEFLERAAGAIFGANAEAIATLDDEEGDGAGVDDIGLIFVEGERLGCAGGIGEDDFAAGEMEGAYGGRRGFGKNELAGRR